MPAQPNPRNVLCRFRNLCVEEANFERSHEYLMFLYGEVDYLKGILHGLRPNAHFQRKYYEYKLDFCQYLLAVWKAKFKAANRAWRAKIRS